MPKIVLIIHDIRSSHNVGSMLRTADGLGIAKVYLSGYTPFPLVKDDARLPHLAAKISRQINKTALGAENSVTWSHRADVLALIRDLRAKGYTVAALEQSKGSKPLNSYNPPAKLALVVGNELEGLEPRVLESVDEVIEIPMKGKKESFNVAVAASMALYFLSIK